MTMASPPAADTPAVDVTVGFVPEPPFSYSFTGKANAQSTAQAAVTWDAIKKLQAAHAGRFRALIRWINALEGRFVPPPPRVIRRTREFRLAAGTIFGFREPTSERDDSAPPPLPDWLTVRIVQRLDVFLTTSLPYAEASLLQTADNIRDERVRNGGHDNTPVGAKISADDVLDLALALREGRHATMTVTEARDLMARRPRHKEHGTDRAAGGAMAAQR